MTNVMKKGDLLVECTGEGRIHSWLFVVVLFFCAVKLCVAVALAVCAVVEYLSAWVGEDIDVSAIALFICYIIFEK